MTARDFQVNNFTTAAPDGYWITGDNVCRINGFRLVRQIQARLRTFIAARASGVLVDGNGRALSERQKTELTAATFVDGKFGPLTSLALMIAADAFEVPEPAADLRRMAAGNGPVTVSALKWAIAFAYYISGTGTGETQKLQAQLAYASILLRASDKDGVLFPTATPLVLPLWREQSPSLGGENATLPPQCSPWETALRDPNVTFTARDTEGAPPGVTFTPYQPNATAPTPENQEEEGGGLGGALLVGVTVAIAAKLGADYLKRNKK